MIHGVPFLLLIAVARLVWRFRGRLEAQLPASRRRRRLELERARGRASEASNDPVTLALLARSLARGGNRREARLVARRAVEAGPNIALTHATLGLVNLGPGRYRHAEAPLREALRLDPLDEAALNNLGVVLHHRSQWRPWDRGLRREALAQFTYAAEQDPDLAVPQQNLSRLGGHYTVGLADWILVLGWVFAIGYAAYALANGARAPQVAAWTSALLLFTLGAWILVRAEMIRYRTHELPASARRFLVEEERRRSWQRWLLLIVCLLPVTVLWIGLWAREAEANAPRGPEWALLAALVAGLLVAVARIAAAVPVPGVYRRA